MFQHNLKHVTSFWKKEVQQNCFIAASSCLVALIFLNTPFFPGGSRIKYPLEFLFWISMSILLVFSIDYEKEYKFWIQPLIISLVTSIGLFL